MKLRLWPYFLKKAVSNVMNNRVVHAIGICTMIVSLLIFGTFLILFVNVNTWIKGWSQSLSMSIYLEDGISEIKKQEVTAFIENLPGSEIKRYVSKDDALRNLRGALGSQAGLLKGLSRNPLPASFEVVFVDQHGEKIDPQKIKKDLETVDGVEDVQYSEEWLKRFEGLLKMIRLVGFIIGGFLCIGILLIVTNTIKLTIYSRRDEIEILKLVGATDWFVKAPFLIEGMIQGVLSGILSLLILFSGYLLLSTKKMYFLGLAVLDFTFIPREYAVCILLISVALGMLGSFIAVGRFFDL